MENGPAGDVGRRTGGGRPRRAAPTGCRRGVGTNGGGFCGSLAAGAGPAPYTVNGSACGGAMYLRHCFRRPNFGTKFGASVIGIGPYERDWGGGDAAPYGGDEADCRVGLRPPRNDRGFCHSGARSDAPGVMVMASRSFVGGLVCAGMSGRPHRAAPTGITEVPCKSGETGGDGAPPLHGGGNFCDGPRRASAPTKEDGGGGLSRRPAAPSQ